MRYAQPAGWAFFPLDEELALTHYGLTPRLQQPLVRLSTWVPFAKACTELAYLTGTQVSQATSRRLTERAGADLVGAQEQQAETILEQQPAAPQGPALQRMSVDGAMVPLVGGEWTERFGISLQTEVALLREQCRLPFRVIQDYLKHRFALRVSVGQLVALVAGVARRGKALVEEFKQQIRGSPVVNGAETGWREDGHNGYVWSFSTDKLRYFVYRKSRAGSVVQEVLGEQFEGVVVSDFYGGYNAHLGMHQRCWVHLLRDIHELKEKHGKDKSLRKWAVAVKAIYESAKGYKGPSAKLGPVQQQAERVKRQREYEQELMRVCRPHLKKRRLQSRLCERLERFLPELFVFVADPRVPADNNAAERSVRELVVSRKISGGTRSERGSETKSILASLFGTWRLQRADFYQCCWNLLATNNPTL
jgi:transposase